MISHVSIGVHDLGRAGSFYDAALAPLGYQRLYDSPEALGYGSESADFWVLRVEHPVAFDPGSGLHFCLQASDRSSVEHFHTAAIEAGGRDNGAPGLRKDYGDNYYAAFVIDPDGYRLEAYCGR